MLKPLCPIFYIDGIEGLIGYVETAKCVAVYGDPVCSPTDQKLLLDAFFERFKNKNILFILASDKLKTLLKDAYQFASIQVGEELSVDPKIDPLTYKGKKSSQLRRNILHAEKAQIVVEEYIPYDEAIEQELCCLATTWLNHRKGLQMYTCKVRLFCKGESKRWFYAKNNHKIIALIVLNKLETKEGWGLDRIVKDPEAPLGATELLLYQVIKKLGKENYHYLTFGSINGSTLGHLSGFSSFTAKATAILFPYILKWFHLANKARFWEKFHPKKYPAYIIIKKPHIGLQEFKVLIKALNLSLPLRWKNYIHRNKP